MNALVGGHWLAVKDGDDRARSLYRRHYSWPRHVRSANYSKFTGPGEYMLLLTADAAAVWLWRIERYRKDGQTGINCAVFRNESEVRSSDLIREAVDLAWRRWPGERLWTYVNPRKVRSTNPGACFKHAGWQRCGVSKGGLVILECLPGSVREGEPWTARRN